MAKISPINIPVTVDPTGMDRGIQTAEQKLRAASRRLQRAAAPAGAGINGGAVRGVAGAGASALGYGALGGALGGLGGAGLALGALALPFFAASRIASALEAATTGAGEQLRKFRESGDIGRFGNQRIADALARLEDGSKARAAKPGFLESFFGAERIAATGRETPSEKLAGMFAPAGAFFGGLVGGADVAGALDLATLASLGPGPAADRFADQAAVNRRSRQGQGAAGPGAKPITGIFDVLIENNFLYMRNLAEYGL